MQLCRQVQADTGWVRARQLCSWARSARVSPAQQHHTLPSTGWAPLTSPQPLRLGNESIPYNRADNSITKNTFHALKCLKALKIPPKPNKTQTNIFWTFAALLQCQDMEETNTVVLHSFLQMTGGSRIQSGWNSKPLALRASIGTLLPSESRATLIRNRNPMKYLSPNLFPVYLGYWKFL